MSFIDDLLSIMLCNCLATEVRWWLSLLRAHPMPFTVQNALMRASMYVCVCVYICVYAYVFVYVCAHVHVYVCIASSHWFPVKFRLSYINISKYHLVLFIRTHLTRCAFHFALAFPLRPFRIKLKKLRYQLRMRQIWKNMFIFRAYIISNCFLRKVFPSLPLMESINYTIISMESSDLSVFFNPGYFNVQFLHLLRAEVDA